MDPHLSESPVLYLEAFTRREREILALLEKRLTDPEIAGELTLALSSVKWYVQQIYRKLGVNNRRQATARARELGLLEDFPLMVSQPGPNHNLPRQWSRFIGREVEMAQVHDLLGEHALVTLTGPGGCGKTRLALETVQRRVQEYSQGIWLVELAGLSDPQLVPRALASALRVCELPGKPLLESLVAFLKPRQLLLILDNCEHLVEVCARMTDTLLRACPFLRILATSREALRIPGECLFLVPPLSIPDLQQHPPFEALASSEAVRLFIERARAALPDFILTERNAPFVAQICTRLDGLPLAIELAAARASLLSIEQIAARIDARFQILTTGSRTAPDRQQTLQAALDWSYHLLSAPEKILFHRLSVFSGGFDLAAAEKVGWEEAGWITPDRTKAIHPGAESSDIHSSPSFLDLLTRLVDKSLVDVKRVTGGRRYRLLETVREYARGKLEVSGEAKLIRQHHAGYFLNLAERAEPELKGGRQLEWLELLDREHNNLRAALAWCLSHGDGETVQRLAGALWYFWYLRGHISEGLRWLEDALVASDGTGTFRIKGIAGAVFLAGRIQTNLDQTENLCAEGMELARGSGEKHLASFLTIQLGFIRFLRSVDDASVAALYADGLQVARETRDRWLIAFSLAHFAQLKRVFREHEQASGIAEEGLAFARETGDRWLIARLLYRLGYAASMIGDFPRARLCHEESLALWRALGDRLSMTYAVLGLGHLAFRQGDYVSAYHYLEMRLAISAEVDHQTGMVHSLNAIGVVAHQMGDDPQAQARFEQGLALSREFNYPWGGAVQLNSLGFLALSQGEAEKARGYFLESLKLFRDLHDRYLLAGNLVGLAKIASKQGLAERAARWLGAVGPSFDYRENTMNPGFDTWIEADEYARDLTGLRAQLGEDAFAAAWEAGRAMGLVQAVTLALAQGLTESDIVDTM